MVVSYLFDKVNTLLNRTTFHNICRDDGMVLLKVNNSVQEIKYWLAGFQQTVDKAAVNQHLQFTA